jgi:hypothetical protein
MSRQQAVAGVLKDRFPNLSVMELFDLTEKIIIAYRSAKEQEYIDAYTPGPAGKAELGKVSIGRMSSREPNLSNAPAEGYSPQNIQDTVNRELDAEERSRRERHHD